MKNFSGIGSYDL